MEMLRGGFTFPEAPVWFEGELWVSDVVDGAMTAVSDTGERLLVGRRGIGGAAVTADGRLLVSGRDIVDARSGATVLARPDGSTGLNDVGVDLDGSLLVGVLNYRPLAGDPPVPGSIARIGSDGAVDWTWRTGLTWPNGIGVLTDGTVVAADFATGHLHAFEPDGQGRVIARSPAGAYDGLAIDSDDNVWVATGPGGTLELRTPSGDLVDTIAIDAGFVSSVCFDGGEPNRIHVTVADCPAADGGGAVLTTTVDSAGPLPPRAALGTN